MKLRLMDKRAEKSKFLKIVKQAVVFEELNPPWTLVRYTGSGPKRPFANYLLENLEEIKSRALANKENIVSKNLVFEIEYPPGEQKKRMYIVKMPHYRISESTMIIGGKARDIEHEFYSNVYLYESVKYPVGYGFEPGKKVVPPPSYLIFNERIEDAIFVRNSMINTPLSIIAGERISAVAVENTIKNVAIAAALLMRAGFHKDLHFANIGIDFSSNRCDVVFFDLENFVPIEKIGKRQLPNAAFQTIASLILVLIGSGIIQKKEQINMFKEIYLDMNEQWIRETEPRIFDAVRNEKGVPSTDNEIALYRARTELRFRNLASPSFFNQTEFHARTKKALYLIFSALKIFLSGRL